LGRNSNYLNKYSVIGSAKWLSFFKKRPTVRGVAKNPVDHPHGGRTKTNNPEVSPWGWVTKYNH
jgi:large subunit ribosomal protein L2